MTIASEDQLRQMRGEARRTIQQQARQPMSGGPRRYRPTPVEKMPEVATEMIGLAQSELRRRQAANNRQLVAPERESDFYDGADVDQRRRLDRIEAMGPRPGTRRSRINRTGSNNSRGRINGNGRGPGGMRGRQSRIGSGRPIGS